MNRGVNESQIARNFNFLSEIPFKISLRLSINSVGLVRETDFRGVSFGVEEFMGIIIMIWIPPTFNAS